ncbi:hypothetical protein MMC11_002450 [Xylographa trunciseda]|nr:hypothetical protein [Xylographa trunciseda]
MSAGPKNPLLSSTMSTGMTGRRQATIPARSSSPIARGDSPSRTLSSNGIARTPSVKSPSGVARPNRASVRRPGQLSSSLSSSGTLPIEDNNTEDDARIESAVLIDNMKKSLRNAETVSEDYQRELAVLQKKLNEVMRDQAKMEERLHESTQRIEELELQKKDISRQAREMGNIFESERMAMLRDREEATGREAELKGTVQRLRETIAGREMRVNVDSDRRTSRSGRTHSRSSSIDEHGNFAPPSAMQRRGSSLRRSDSPNTSRLVMQKDMAIESLRLELAEAQIKLVEMENMGGDRLQEIEKTLLETRMTNARLMEDNESFQLLLGEKTLSGDFAKTDFMQGPPASDGTSGLGSLAEELEAADGESENFRRLEAESKSLRDQNKALTLYIEKIISRVLMHENFETILDQKPEPLPEMQKNLPPLPPPKDGNMQASVLQRAISVVGGPRRSRPQSQLVTSVAPVANDEITPKARVRPQSQIFASAPAIPTKPNEDPFTAPQVPLGRKLSMSAQNRGHRRTQSEQSDATAHAAVVVNQMYRGPSPAMGGPTSPVSPGGTTPQTSYFAPPAIVGNTANNNPHRPSPGASRTASGYRATSDSQGRNEKLSSSSNSAFSRDSGEGPSPPRNRAGETNYTGAVMTQSRLRPLRLVQENKEMENQQSRRISVIADEELAARKKANRGSWMGWFNRKDEAGPRSVSAGNVQE